MTRLPASESHILPMSLLIKPLRSLRAMGRKAGGLRMRLHGHSQHLKLVDTDAGQATSRPTSPNTPAVIWHPRNDWHPGQRDSIEQAESALEHMERQMQNLRQLLGINESSNGPRAA